MSTDSLLIGLLVAIFVGTIASGLSGIPLPDESDEPDHWYEALYSDSHGYWYVDRRDQDGGATVEMNLTQDRAEAMAASLNQLRGKTP